MLVSVQNLSASSPTFPPPGDPLPARGVSILISGTGETAMSMLALGFARRVDQAFGWADFSASPSALDGAARRMFVEGTEGRRVEHATVRELSTPSERPPELGTFLTPEPGSREFEGRLRAFLALPDLFQTLLGRTLSPTGEGVILLTNVDAVSSAAARKTLELPTLHDTLHREGVTLLVTYRGTPPSSLSKPFDEVFQVEHLGQSWPDALLVAPQSNLLPGLLAPRRLRECWPALGLGPDLLPV